jgi:hypothetical protein
VPRSSEDTSYFLTLYFDLKGFVPVVVVVVVVVK